MFGISPLGWVHTFGSLQLKLAIMCTIAPALLIQLFARFRSSRPDVKLELIDGTAQSVEEQLVASAAEIAIYCRPDRASDSRLNYLPLFREQMMIVLPSTHRFVSHDQIEISDLAGERYCSGRSVSSTTSSTACSTPAASIAKPSTAAIGTIGCWP
jgi:DNA-binding transcriptional LysR family regulator